ncbi:HEPN domain-containing protein [Mucilaginibacter sp. OAE612]|uniref:HEPN domain-containing protein n=1 Tax=Mucilaginibacter sp. OAE612 TaxID=3156444 RepID=UPI00359F095D
MQNTPIKITARQHKELLEIAKALTGHYRIEKIICFAALHCFHSSDTCFTEPDCDSSDQYYLLVMTKENTRIEHQMQDFIGKLFPGTTVLAHGLETIMSLVYQYDRFFLNVCLNGELVFTSDGFTMVPEFENEKTEQTIVKDIDAYHQIFGLACGFVECAFDCHSKGFYNNVTFILHQAVEHGCRALIRLFTGYKSDIHNLDRLITFCSLFPNEPVALFRRHFDKEKQLFRLLSASYTEARYRDHYKVNELEAGELCVLVKSFLELVKSLAEVQIRKLTQINNYQNGLAFKNDNPALPVA